MNWARQGLTAGSAGRPALRHELGRAQADGRFVREPALRHEIVAAGANGRFGRGARPAA